MFEFVKKVLFVVMTVFGFNGIVFSPSNVHSLKCVSINNQECKPRTKLIDVNSNEPMFHPFSIKVNKCSGSCNSINDPYAKLCVPDISKNINVKVFNLMSRINETRHEIWHETCKCKCRLSASVCNNRQRWNEDKCRCECKELTDKGICDKGFIWNPSNFKCECNKSCGIVEYLDYKNCVCRNSIVDKLVKECTKIVDENNIYNETLNTTSSNDSLSDCTSCKHSIICSVSNNKCNNWWCFSLFLLVLKKDIVRQYLKKNNISIKFNSFKKQIIKLINGKY